MTYDSSGNEVVVPYGQRNASNHIRLKGDYLTFCGRKCDDWSVVEGMTFVMAIDSAYTCKRCMKGCFK